MIYFTRYLISCAVAVFPLLAFAEVITLRHCPKPADYTITTQHQTYGTFIQWRASNVVGIPYTNNNAHALVPLALTLVRLEGQAVTCVYEAAAENELSQVKTVIVSTSNFGDVGLSSKFMTKNTISCPYHVGGVCCNPLTTDCRFEFIKGNQWY